MSNIRTLAFLEGADLCVMFARNLSTDMPNARDAVIECAKLLEEAANLARDGKDVYSLVTNVKGTP